MLLDEVQELARVSHTIGLIRSLRTGLDINQQKIKVIFYSEVVQMDCGQCLITKHHFAAMIWKRRTKKRRETR